LISLVVIILLFVYLSEIPFGIHQNIVSMIVYFVFTVICVSVSGLSNNSPQFFAHLLDEYFVPYKLIHRGLFSTLSCGVIL